MSRDLIGLNPQQACPISILFGCSYNVTKCCRNMGGAYLPNALNYVTLTDHLWIELAQKNYSLISLFL